MQIFDNRQADIFRFQNLDLSFNLGGIKRDFTQWTLLVLHHPHPAAVNQQHGVRRISRWGKHEIGKAKANGADGNKQKYGELAADRSGDLLD